MKSPIFGKEKLLYFPQKSGIVPIFKKSPSSYISYFCHHAPCTREMSVYTPGRAGDTALRELWRRLTC